MDERGDGSEAPGPRDRIWPTLLLIFAGGGLFAGLLVTYILRSAPMPVGPLLVETSDAERPGPDTLAIAQRVAGAFVEALHAGDTADAYGQMAGPYRAGATLGTFRAAWKTPLLAGPRAVSLSRSSESATPIDGKLVKGATFTARGMLVVAAGPLDTTFTFLHEGGDVRVLAVFVGGIPIVQGIATSAPPP